MSRFGGEDAFKQFFNAALMALCGFGFAAITAGAVAQQAQPTPPASGKTMLSVESVPLPDKAPEAVGFKIPFVYTRRGDLAKAIMDTITNPTVMAGLIEAGCLAYGDDCSGVAGVLLGVSANVAGGDIHGVVQSPNGYTICKAKIDWTHTGIDEGSTFNSSFIRTTTFTIPGITLPPGTPLPPGITIPPVGGTTIHTSLDGLGFYVFVSDKAGRGTGVTSDVYLEFVKNVLGPGGEDPLKAHNCMGLGPPPADYFAPWICTGHECAAGPGQRILARSKVSLRPRRSALGG